MINLSTTKEKNTVLLLKREKTPHIERGREREREREKERRRDRGRDKDKKEIFLQTIA